MEFPSDLLVEAPARSTAPPSGVTEDHAPITEEQRIAILSILGDDTSREILETAERPMTAKELIETCSLPRSTVYRKLDRLASTPLMEETTRPRVYGKHPEQYQRRPCSIRIHVPPTGALEVAVVEEPADDHR